MNGYRLDELYNMIQQTKRKEIQLEKTDFLVEIIAFIILAIVISCVCGLNYTFQKIQCTRTAKVLNYKSEYNYVTGCILEKPNGKKILLKQLRDYGE